MKLLQVIEQAFRTTVEEQDDTIIWLTRSMRSAGANLSLLLVGHGVYYAVQKGRQPALTLGAWWQTEPAELSSDLKSLLKSGVSVYAAKEDIYERGLSELPVIKGVKVIDRNAIVQLYDQVDQIWHW
jgi:sulfur transfer complex TusBCD TusB component (DsrH family)